ncbi:MAG: sugar phosphate isomerase/epimerase [Planctomycetaceae bacterium]|nr:sugar phosphate isomerase/epimerase [Planctomycetaceae bacterium]
MTSLPTPPHNRRQFLARSVSAATAGLFLSPSFALADEPLLPYFENRGWLVGCWTRPWAAFDYRVGMDAMVEAGFKYVALTGAKTRTKRVIAVDTTLEEAATVGEEAKQRGLTITNVYGGGVALEKGPQDLRKLIDNCQAAGGLSVLLSGIGNEQTYEACCRTVAECCDYAAEKRIAIVLKPHGGTTGTGPQIRDAAGRVNRPNFTVMYDPGNIFYYSEGKVNPVEDVKAVAGLVTGVSVKDYLPPNNVALTPGAGNVDFPALFAELRRGGLKGGPLMIEMVNPGDPDQTLDEVKKAKRFVEQLVGIA